MARWSKRRLEEGSGGSVRCLQERPEKICSMQRESWKTPTRGWRKSGGESALRIRDTVKNISSVQQRSAFRNRRYIACGTRL